MAYEYDYRPHRLQSTPETVQSASTMPIHGDTQKTEISGYAPECIGDDETLHGVEGGTDRAHVASETSGEDGNEAFELEQRIGGCDIRRSSPKPHLLYEEAVYASWQTNETEKPSSAGGGELVKDQKNIKGSAILILGWSVCAIVVLWMFTAASPFIANALTQHGWRLWASLVLGSLPIVSVVGLMVYVLRWFLKVPKVEQFNRRSFPNKAELQRHLSTSYLANIPNPERYATDNGFANADGKRDRTVLVECLNHLRRGASDSRAWLVEFDRFQSIQDERAKEIIFNVSKHVGLTTAACPWRLLDMITVVYHSTLMITRLAKLYNRQTSRYAAFWLGCHWITNIYVSGIMQDAAQQGIEIAASSLGGLTNFFSKALGAVVGKSTEGLVNALLVTRLGHCAMAYFRPLC